MKKSAGMLKSNLLVFIRSIGYRPHHDPHTGSISFIRSLGGSLYPRFHLYITKQKGEQVLDLHLDQKATSYEGSAAHAGEYEGPMVEQEMKRILSKNT